MAFHSAPPHPVSGGAAAALAELKEAAAIAEKGAGEPESVEQQRRIARTRGSEGTRS
jgi:hypothetical protein